MRSINYDGRTFRPSGEPEGGDVGADTVFHYHQSGSVVWATYEGGAVAFGTLVAQVLDDGRLDMRYQQVTTTGATKAGRCLSTPEVLPDGRLRLHEEWTWTEGGVGSGTSQVEEVGSRPSLVETSTPPGTPAPIGPYSHVAKVGRFISIGGTAAFDPDTGHLAGPDAYSQTTRILESFRVMLESAGSDLRHVVHVNVFLANMRDFEEMNRAYVAAMGMHRPARTVIGVNELPKPGVLLTMNLTAVTRD